MSYGWNRLDNLNDHFLQPWWAEKHLRTHMTDLEANLLQQQITTSGLTYVSQEYESEATMGMGSQKKHGQLKIESSYTSLFRLYQNIVYVDKVRFKLESSHWIWRHVNNITLELTVWWFFIILEWLAGLRNGRRYRLCSHNPSWMCVMAPWSERHTLHGHSDRCTKAENIFSTLNCPLGRCFMYNVDTHISSNQLNHSV